ncbi:MAG: helix-turn-helix domain-containing protein [Nocardioidaceae bacterium]
MAEKRDAGVGERVSAWREHAGLTQHALAERAHVSYSLLRKVERGERRATAAFVAAVARSLGVEAESLTDDRMRGYGVTGLLPPIRSALDLFDLPPDETITPRPLPVLRAAVTEINRLAQAAEYERMSTRLPALLGELHTAAHTLSGRDREQAYALLALAARCGHSVGIAVGSNDLSVTALSRMDWAARQAGDHGPALRAAREYLRITAYLRVRDLDAARRLNASGVALVDGADDAPAGLVARGQLHLGASIIAAYAGDREGIDGHLQAGCRIAERTGERLTDLWFGFGPTNVQVHRAMALGTLGEHGRAVEAGAGITFPAEWLPTRIGHHHLDMARAYRWLNRPDDALASLVEARRAAPGQARRHPLARETVTALLHTQRRRTAALTDYATWMDA